MLRFSLQPVIQILPFRASALLKDFLSTALDVFSGRIAVERNEFAHTEFGLRFPLKRGSALPLALITTPMPQSGRRALWPKKHLTHGIQQPSNREWLGQQRVAFQTFLAGDGGRGQNDRDWNQRLSDFVDQFQARQARHLIVRDDQMVRHALESSPGLCTIGDGVHVVAGPIQHDLAGAKNASVIVGIENADAGIAVVPRFQTHPAVAREWHGSIGWKGASDGGLQKILHDSSGWALGVKPGWCHQYATGKQPVNSDASPAVAKPWLYPI